MRRVGEGEKEAIKRVILSNSVIFWQKWPILPPESQKVTKVCKCAIILVLASSSKPAARQPGI